MAANSGPPGHDPNGWVFFDGEFKRYGDVHLGLMTHALHYGTGCYEGLRAYWNQTEEQLFVVQPTAHFDRMQNSARILMLELPHSTEELVEITLDLIRRNEYRGDIYIRPVLFKSSEGIGVASGKAGDSFGIYSSRFGKYLDTENGIRCLVSSWRRIPDIAVPVRAKVTGGYINSNLAKAEASRAGYDEAILLDIEGHVSEGTGENLFMFRNGTWFTPPVTNDILEGITRRALMDLISKELGLVAAEREIDRTELYSCDEILLCGTGAEVVPVIEVDGRSVGSGKVGDLTRRLQEFYFAAVRGEEKKYSDWVVPVY